MQQNINEREYLQNKELNEGASKKSPRLSEVLFLALLKNKFNQI